jgi:glutathione S-transferase
MITITAPPHQAGYFQNLLATRWQPNEYTVLAADQPAKLRTPDLVIADPLIATLWIDRKVPCPELIPRDPDRMTQVLSILDRMFQHPVEETARLPAYLAHRRPFLLGRRLTVLDLWAAAHCNDPVYQNTVQRAIDLARVRPV